MDSPKLVTFSSSQKKIQEILRDLEKIQETLQGSVTWNEAPKKQVEGERIISRPGLIKEVGSRLILFKTYF